MATAGEPGDGGEQRGPIRVGVLALQGSFREHAAVLGEVVRPVETVMVRRAADLADLDGLIIPGGESTAMAQLMARPPTDLAPGGGGTLGEAMGKWLAAGRPTMGTCAGLILLAEAVEGRPAALGAARGRLPCRVRPNAYGAQGESFVGAIEVSPRVAAAPASGGREAIFIRAPRILDAAADCAVLARLSESGAAVALERGNVVGLAFHPELSEEGRDRVLWHDYFISKIVGQGEAPPSPSSPAGLCDAN